MPPGTRERRYHPDYGATRPRRPERRAGNNVFVMSHCGTSFDAFVFSRTDAATTSTGRYRPQGPARPGPDNSGRWRGAVAQLSWTELQPGCFTARRASDFRALPMNVPCGFGRLVRVGLRTAGVTGTNWTAPVLVPLPSPYNLS